ncbi:MAG: gliding motility-associated C-terminal domain-containing protein [Chitinophagales bacterium]
MVSPLVLIISLLCFRVSLNAQVFLNGALVHSNSNSLIYVQTDSLIINGESYFLQEGELYIDKDLIILDGNLNIDGLVDVEGNILNNDSLVGLSASSEIHLKGNWTNNQFFSAGLNSTYLDGNVQLISGSAVSNFYNLINLGSLLDVKRLVGVNSIVLNQLDLGDVEFATDGHTLTVLNPNINAILRNNGFVSSIDSGRLERLVNSTQPYLFPTGSSLGVLRYRPIEIRPTTNLVDTFGVRLANVNATNEGYDVLKLSDSLCAVNPSFYHRIYGNTEADISMFYLPQEDGNWDAMAQWQMLDEWDKLPQEINSNAGQFSSLRINAWSNFEENAFALGIQKPYLDLVDTLQVDLGQSLLLSPTYVGANPSQVLWFPFDEIACPNCLETEIEPSISQYYNLEISVNQHCRIVDSVLILVNPGSLFLPTGFSPNSDGVNDLFYPLNNNLDYYLIKIFNRWGELVYFGNELGSAWDGTYKGRNAEIGVYSFYSEYRFKNNTAVESLNGNVTLIR